MGNERNARGPEIRVFLGAGNLLAELRRELAVDGRGVNADFLEHAAMHQAHRPATALGAGMIGALPGCADKRRRRFIAVRRRRRQIAL